MGSVLFSQAWSTAFSGSFADGNVCDVCGKAYLNADRFSRHLHYISDCLEELQKCGAVCALSPGHNSRAWRLSNPWSQCPFLITEGPCFFSNTEFDDDLTEPDFVFLDEMTALEGLLDDNACREVEHWVECFVPVCMHSTFPISRIQQLLTWAPGFAERWFRRRLRPVWASTFHKAIKQLAQDVSVEFFLPDQHREWVLGCQQPITFLQRSAWKSQPAPTLNITCRIQICFLDSFNQCLPISALDTVDQVMYRHALRSCIGPPVTLSLNQWEAVPLASSSETFGLTLR